MNYLKKQKILLFILLIPMILIACNSGKKEVKIRFDIPEDFLSRNERTGIVLHIKSEKLEDEKAEEVDLYYNLDEKKDEGKDLKLPAGVYNIEYPYILSSDKSIYEINNSKKIDINKEKDLEIINLIIKDLDTNKLSLDDRETILEEIERFDKESNNSLLNSKDKENIKAIRSSIEDERKDAKINEMIFEQFNIYLDNPETVDKNNNFDCEYSYAIKNISNSKYPQLLIRCFYNNFSSISAVLLNTDTEKFDIIEDVGGEGPRTATIYSDGGLFISGLSGGTGLLSLVHHKIIDNELVEEIVYQGNFMEKPDSIKFEGEEIEWTEVLDRSTLLQAFGKSDEERALVKANDEKALEDIKEKKIKDTKAKGNLIIEGMVYYFETNDEICEFQGVKDPNADYPHSEEQGPFGIIKLDKNTAFPAYYDNGKEGEKETELIKINYLDAKKLQGHRVTMLADKSFLYWPSDTSLPLGVPWVSYTDIFESDN